MEKLRDIASLLIDNNSEKLYHLSQDIWKNPELAFEEVYAHKVLTDFLEEQGFQVTRSYKLATGFKAEYGSDTNGPNIAILCEYDALPEIGHACGHNLIAEVGVAAGMAVKAALEYCDKQGKSMGKVTVMGTPAEEGAGGKIHMIKAGAFDGIDAAMMAHPSYVTISRPLFLAIRVLRIEFHGKAAHSSSCPWEGINALDAAVLTYQSVSNMRQHMRPEYRVHGIITKGGVKPNIVPDHTEMLYYVRCPTTAEVQVLYDKIIKCCEAAALATGCTGEYSTPKDDLEYYNLISNNAMSTLFEHYSDKLGLSADTTPSITLKFGGSTDMGNLSHEMPGIHPKYWICDSPIHSRDFAVKAGTREAQTNTLKVAKSLAYVALDLLHNPELLAKAKEDFKRDIEAKKE